MSTIVFTLNIVTDYKKFSFLFYTTTLDDLKNGMSTFLKGINNKDDDFISLDEILPVVWLVNKNPMPFTNLIIPKKQIECIYTEI